MAMSRTRYTWTVRHEDPLMAVVVVDDVARVCDLWCAIDRRTSTFRDVAVGGERLGLTTLSVTVCARDRWASHRRAMEFAQAIAAVAHVSLTVLTDPSPSRLKPHDHRGRRRFLAPKYAEATGG